MTRKTLVTLLLVPLLAGAPVELRGDASGTVKVGAWSAAPMDWPHWRGPEMNGISREKNLPEKFNPRGGPGSNLLWKKEEFGGRSTPIVMNGKLYMLCRHNPETRQQREKVVCLDAKTGEPLWENVFNVFLSDVPDTRVAWSSVVGDPETGNVFALGVCDYFQAIDGETGKTLWSRSLSEEYGMLSTYGGRTNFPVIHGDLVIISGIIIGWGDYAKPAHRFIAFDKRNGQPVWFEQTRLFPYDTTYSAPVITVIAGQAQMIFASGDGALHGFQPQTGKSLWSYQISPKRGINITPLVVGNTVFAGNSEENVGDNTMGALLAVDASQGGKELWRIHQKYVGRSSPVMAGERLIAVEDNANLLVADPETGKILGSRNLGTMMRGSPLYADGKIYCCTANGRWYVLRLKGENVQILDRQRLYGEAHGSPIVSHGRIYLPTSDGLYCIGRENVEPQAEPRPDPPREAPVESDPKPAHLQLVPVESLLRPGQTQPYQVRLYNSRGQFVRLVEPGEVKFSISGPGRIDEQGRYHAEGDHDAVQVTAEAAGLKGQARVRVVPDLPWNFDFDEGEIPVTWVGIRYRHVPVDFPLFEKLKKAGRSAGQLYLYLESNFVNSGNDALKLTDNSPRRTWTDLLRFLEIESGPEHPATLAAAQKKFDPMLKRLQDEKFLAGWDWDEVGGQIELTVKRGPRKTGAGGAMVKITTIPKGARSQGWMGHTHLSDYTIQADVYAGKRETVLGAKLPDIGLIAQRYTLDLMGQHQKLQIRTWTPQLQMAREAPFSWEPETWYTLKFRAAVEDGRAVLRGKVWKRGEAEPKEWTVEATDPIPNTEGSPGLFGNAKDAEIFYDNIRVYRNEG